MKDCLFCKIINGEIPSYKIYEDDFCYAFLDIANDVYGHTLVIPKKHYESMMTADTATLSRMIETCKKIGNHYVKDCGFDGYNLFNCTGEAAQQSVFHVHFHILPRKLGDGKNIMTDLGVSGAELSDICAELALKEEPAEVKKQPHEDVDPNSVVLYTDGACSGNPGAGGWAAILSYKGKEKILSGGERETTNNRMELMAIIQGLEAVKKGQSVVVFSDSAYSINAFHQGWITKWAMNGWRNSSGDEVANKELWQRLLNVIEHLNVEFVKVKGHSDNINNNRCDALAREEIAKLGAE